MFETLAIALENTGRHVWALFFWPGVMGLLIHLAEKGAYKVQRKAFGHWFTVFFTGWIGVPIHELGHVLFCILFMHEVEEVKLFSPSEHEGTLGFVKHSYNPRNPIAVAGNFFIGFAPLLSGSAVIWLCLRSGAPPLLGLFDKGIGGLADSSFWIEAVPSAVSKVDTGSVRTWLSLYAAFCTASHMGPSYSDFKGGLSGAVAIFATLFLLELVGSLADFGFPGSGTSFLKSAGTGLTRLMFPAFFMAFSSLVISWLAAILYSLATERKPPVPW